MFSSTLLCENWKSVVRNEYLYGVVISVKSQNRMKDLQICFQLLGPPRKHYSSTLLPLFQRSLLQFFIFPNSSLHNSASEFIKFISQTLQKGSAKVGNKEEVEIVLLTSLSINLHTQPSCFSAKSAIEIHGSILLTRRNLEKNLSQNRGGSGVYEGQH